MTETAKLIRCERMKACLSQKKLAELCGISDSAVNRLEKGKIGKTDWQYLCRIAKALKLHPFQFMLAEGYITEKDIHPDEKLYGLNDLSSEEISELQDYVNYLHFKRGQEGDIG